MSELLLLIALFLAGVGFFRLFACASLPVFTAAAAFPLGLIIWVGCYLFIYFLPLPPADPLPFNVTLTWQCFVLCALLLGGSSLYRARLTRRELIVYSLAVAMLALVERMMAHVPVKLALNPDSYTFLDITKPIGYSWKLLRAIFMTCLQATGLLVHYDLMQTLVIQCTAVSVSVLIGYVVFEEIRQSVPSASAREKCWIVGMSCLPILVLFCSPMGLLMLLYVNHHLLAATFIFLFAASWWLVRQTHNPLLLYPGILALMAFTLTRIEGLLFASALLPIFLSDPAIPAHHQRNASMLVLGGLLPWQLYVMWSLGDGRRVVTADQQLIIGAFFIAVMLSFQLNRWKLGRRMIRTLPWLLPLAGFGGFVVFTWLKPEHMLTTLYHVSMNLLIDRHGGWGTVWYWLIMATPVLLGVKRSPRARRCDRLGAASLTLVLLGLNLIFFRGATRLGMFDSANRMIVHVLPLLLVWVVIQMGHLGVSSPHAKAIAGAPE
ncbi:hypothetical protein GF339_21250 [candidate division KSB3 bacterium]|uniref:Uncharacterized protein n=1 Tax=candidate division KSB3 bacterium TaxID=2044937 RepID=A0A9D5JZL1_9BACT|nr:hypothetical protein [candidate division KSB3 bacterium]MBD3327128.1 hypothetical protein [candidate division KSB3 bacterium]